MTGILFYTNSSFQIRVRRGTLYEVSYRDGYERVVGRAVFGITEINRTVPTDQDNVEIQPITITEQEMTSVE